MSCAIANGMAVGSLRWETLTARPRASSIKPRIALWLYLGAAFVFVRIVTQEPAGGGMQALTPLPRYCKDRRCYNSCHLPCTHRDSTTDRHQNHASTFLNISRFKFARLGEHVHVHCNPQSWLPPEFRNR
jgi:hypothetical protein